MVARTKIKVPYHIHAATTVTVCFQISVHHFLGLLNDPTRFVCYQSDQFCVLDRSAVLWCYYCIV